MVNMYPTFPTSRGPSWVAERCLVYGMSSELVDWIKELVIVMLGGNVFMYDGKLYIQKTGTAIGAPFACAYSGIVMGKIEEDSLKRWRCRKEGGGGIIRGQEWKEGDPGEVDWWSRFRDDCISLWRGTRLEFEQFVEIMNSVDKDIKITAVIDWDNNRIIFLDTVVYIDEEGYLQTSLYVKKNMKNCLLLPSSCHLPSVTSGTVYGLALRVRRIASVEVEAQKAFKELEEKLLRREYNRTIVMAGINKAKAMTRKEALKSAERGRGWKKEKGPRQHRLIIEYDRRTGHIFKEALENNYRQMIEEDQRMKTYFPVAPKPTFKRGTNIKELLCRAKLLPLKKNIATRAEVEQYRNGVMRCSKGKCTSCSIITSSPEEVVREVTIYNTGEKIPIQGWMDCKT